MTTIKAADVTAQDLQNAESVTIDVTIRAVQTLREVADGIESGRFSLHSASWVFQNKSLPLQMLSVLVVDEKPPTKK